MGELKQRVAGEAAEADAGMWRDKANKLEMDVSKLQKELDVKRSQSDHIQQESKKEELDHLQKRQAVEQELRQLQKDVKQLPKLDADVAKLRRDKESADKYWRKMFSEYHLIGQAFFGPAGKGATGTGEPTSRTPMPREQTGVPSEVEA